MDVWFRYPVIKRPASCRTFDIVDGSTLVDNPRLHLMRTFLPLFLTVVLGCLAVSAAERPQQVAIIKQVTITARPTFEDQGQFTYLLLTNAQHSYRFLWGMPQKVQFVPVTLDTNRTYTFTFEERPYESITIPELHRVQQDGQIVYDIEVCEVHKTKMEHEEVPILYGLIRRSPDGPSSEEERNLFPHERECSFGGCTVGSQKTDWVYVCKDCKKAYEKWKADYKKTK
jgi:hypothetical protein